MQCPIFCFFCLAVQVGQSDVDEDGELHDDEAGIKFSSREVDLDGMVS